MQLCKKQQGKTNLDTRVSNNVLGVPRNSSPAGSGTSKLNSYTTDRGVQLRRCPQQPLKSYANVLYLRRCCSSILPAALLLVLAASHAAAQAPLGSYLGCFDLNRLIMRAEDQNRVRERVFVMLSGCKASCLQTVLTGGSQRHCQASTGRVATHICKQLSQRCSCHCGGQPYYAWV